MLTLTGALGAAGALAAWGLTTRPPTDRGSEDALRSDPRLAAALTGRGASAPSGAGSGAGSGAPANAPARAAATAPTAAGPRYPAPTKKAHLLSWPRANKWWHTQRPGDPQSPRVTAMLTEPADRVRSMDEAFARFSRETGLALAAAPRFETFEAWRQFDGTDLRVALAETRLGGAPGVAMLVVSRQNKDKGQFRVWAAETTRETFHAWGGIAGMMVMYGDLPSIGVVPAARRAQIAYAPFPQQVAFHEAVVNRVYTQVATQLMASQLAITQQMTQINYNLLFGKPVTAPSWQQR